MIGLLGGKRASTQTQIKKTGYTYRKIKKALNPNCISNYFKQTASRDTSCFYLRH